MSLLIATNLIDRIYICADTRLTRSKNAEVVLLHDNQLKIEHIPGTRIAVGCVGSPTLGAFLLKKIKLEFQALMYAHELLDFLANQKDLIKTWIDEFLCAPPQTSYKDARCVLLFAGQDTRRKRVVRGKRVIELVKEYQSASSERINRMFGNKPVEDFSSDEMGRFIYEANKDKLMLKKPIIDAIRVGKQSDGMIELELPEQALFALEIDVLGGLKHERDPITLREFEFGQTAVYGAGLSTEILAPDFFGVLDLNKNSGEFFRDIIPFVSTIKDRYADTIGGSICNIIIHDGSVSTLAQCLRKMPYPGGPEEVIYDIRAKDGRLHHVIDGELKQLLPFSEITKDSDKGGRLIF